MRWDEFNSAVQKRIHIEKLEGIAVEPAECGPRDPIAKVDIFTLPDGVKDGAVAMAHDDVVHAFVNFFLSEISHSVPRAVVFAVCVASAFPRGVRGQSDTAIGVQLQVESEYKRIACDAFYNSVCAVVVRFPIAVRKVEFFAVEFALDIAAVHRDAHFRLEESAMAQVAEVVIPHQIFNFRDLAQLCNHAQSAVEMLRHHLFVFEPIIEKIAKNEQLRAIILYLRKECKQ